MLSCSHFRSLSVFALLATCPSAFTTTVPKSDDPSQSVTANLGAKFNSAWFYVGTGTPRVGIEVKRSHLLDAISRSVNAGFSPSELVTALDVLEKATLLSWSGEGSRKAPRLSSDLLRLMQSMWTVSRIGGPDTNLLEAAGARIVGGDVYLILKESASYNGKYRVQFNLRRFLEFASARRTAASSSPGQGPVVPESNEYIVHATKVDGKLDESVFFTERRSYSVTGTGIPASVDLIAFVADDDGQPILNDDGKVQYRKADARRFDVMTSQIGTFSLFPFASGRQTISVLSSKSKISEVALDRESALSLTSTTLLSWKSPLRETAPVGYGRLSTSQNLRDTTLTFGLALRHGDRRTPGATSMHNFVRFDEVTEGVFLEAGAEFGYNAVKRLRHVETQDGVEGFQYRGKMVLAWKKDLKKSPSLEGGITLYLLPPRSGGAADGSLRLAEDVDMKLVFRSKENHEFFIQYVTGHNPDSRFTRRKPEVKVGISRKA